MTLAAPEQPDPGQPVPGQPVPGQPVPARPVPGQLAASPLLPLAKRNALVLAAAQAVVGAAAPVSISMGGLAGAYLLAADKSLATAPVAGYNVGVALGAVPAALLMRAIGRRMGFMSGAMVTALGGAVAAAAIVLGQFWLFAVGLLMVGFASAFAQQYRFAATDHAPDDFKPRAISWVLAGGLFAALIGYAMVYWLREIFAPISFAGVFVGIAGLGLAGALIVSLLRVPDASLPAAPVDPRPARPLGEIVRQPAYLVALACSITGYALMSFVMTGAPLAMVACGFSVETAAFAIMLHVMAMFGPSFFTGRLIVRFGRDRIILTGMALLVGCAAFALTGIELANFWGALILLGVGWNFAFIGATSLVTTTYRPSERSKAQGFHDLVMFGSVAFASLMSGATFNAFGWDALNWIILPAAMLCTVILLLFRRATAAAA